MNKELINKELINKYKVEFDHWLNEGKLLTRTKSDFIWNDRINEDLMWSFEIKDIDIIINDEYVEFRKALTEGETIQINNSNPETWIDIDTDKLANYNPSFLRIKPKFKIGDFVKYIHSTPAKALEINNINGNRYYFTNSEMSCLKHELEPWTPVKGEWCWFTDDKTNEEVTLGTFERVASSLYQTTHWNAWIFCEPFLNSLPSYLKDK